MLKRIVVFLVFFYLASLPAVNALSPSWDPAPELYSPQRVPFQIQLGEIRSDQRIITTTVLPGKNLELRAEGGPHARFELVESPFKLEPAEEWRWSGRAPENQGIYVFELLEADSGQRMWINVIVLVSRKSKRNGVLHGFRIGSYPSKPLNGLPIYLPPDGFVEVTARNEETWLSPHFQLRQFLCKQEGGYPKYLVLDEKLPLKLEFLLEAVNNRGIPAKTFSILSGYRTPFYNRAIGNGAYSRHLWGSAADIFIDNNGDGQMDDLNGDGRVDRKDAELLYSIVDSLYEEPEFQPFFGGLASYNRNQVRGPFIHVDVRGARARWGR